MTRLILFSIYSTLLLLSSCQKQALNYFFDCYEKGKKKLIKKLVKDFELQLNQKYSQNDFAENIVLYLKNFQSENQNFIIQPSEHLANHPKTKSMVEDIWAEKSLRPTSEFMRCLKQSENQITIEYLDRVSIIGDMAVEPVSKGAIKIINKNREIDPEFKLILTINFYLIWLNDPD